MTKATSPPEAREPRARGSAGCTFLLATDLLPREPAWRKAAAQADAVAAACAPVLGFEPAVRLAAVGGYQERRIGSGSLGAAIAREIDDGAGEVFVLPVALDFNLFQREAIGETIGESRRRRVGVSIYRDDVDPGHPLLVECLSDRVAQALSDRAFPPQRTGLILASTGNGDAASRAQSYRLMRLLWEQLGLGGGEVGFLRGGQPFLLPVLEKCAKRPLEWIVLPQAQWKTEHAEYTELILRDFQRSDPDSAEWRLAEPPGDHPAMTAWLTQRITRLWQETRTGKALPAR